VVCEDNIVSEISPTATATWMRVAGTDIILCDSLLKLLTDHYTHSSGSENQPWSSIQLIIIIAMASLPNVSTNRSVLISRGKKRGAEDMSDIEAIRRGASRVSVFRATRCESNRAPTQTAS
jgi:hypothetical protein